MNQSLHPDWDIARSRYPIVLQAVLNYARHVDEVGDETLDEYRALEQRLHVLTGKEMSAFNLHEWWEEEGAEVLAFRIALPDPPRLEQPLPRDAIADVVNRRMSVFDRPSGRQADDFVEAFTVYLDSWHLQLLALNAPHFEHNWFNRQRNRDGQWFEYSNEELTDLLWSGRLSK